MNIPAEPPADLRSLTDALDEPGIDLEGLLRALLEDIRLAVPSYLGLTITSIIDGYPVTLTALDTDTDTRHDQRISDASAHRPG